MKSIQKYSRQLAILSAASASMMCMAVAQAQAASGDAAGVEEEDAGVKVIVVTAQKREESIQDVPIAISAFSAEELKSVSINNIQDLNNFVPSFRNDNPGNASQSTITIRGVGQRDTTNLLSEQAVVLFVDGAYVSFMTAGAQPLYDLERIEVLKGPQGTLFGRNATGGLVNIVTAQPTDYFEGYAHAEYGSFEAVKLEGAVSGPISDTVSARLSVHYNRNDGYLKNLNGPDLNANNSLAARLQVRIEPTDNFSLTLSGRYWQAFDQPSTGVPALPFIQTADGPRPPESAAEYAAYCASPPRFATPPAGAWQQGSCFQATPDRFTGFYGTQERYSQTYYAGTATAVWDLNSDVTLTSITDYESVKQHLFLVPAPLLTDPAGLTLQLDQRPSHQFSQEVRLNGKATNFEWVAGVYFLDIDGHSITTNFNNGTTFDADFVQKTSSLAAFAQVDWAFTDKLSLSLGGRVGLDRKSIVNESFCDGFACMFFPDTLAVINGTYEAELSETAWSGRAVLEYRPVDDVLVYAGLTRGIKGAGFNAGIAQFYPVDAATYEGEILLNYEAGFKTSLLDNRVVLNGSAFYYDYNNYQTYLTNSSGGKNIQNVDATVKGAELTITTVPVKGLTLSGGAAYLDTLQKGVPLDGGGFGNFQMPNAPEWTVTGQARYSTEVSGGDEASVQLNAIYVGERSFQALDFAATRIPSYYRFDARISYQLPNQDVTISAYVNNLTDETIIQSRTDFTALAGTMNDVLSQPRWYGVSVNFEF